METKKIILKMFARYPSLATANGNQIAAMAAAYLETLQTFSSETVSAACEAFKRKGSAFPPSADELFVECEKLSKTRKTTFDVAWERALAFRSEGRSDAPALKYDSAKQIGNAIPASLKGGDA